MILECRGKSTCNRHIEPVWAVASGAGNAALTAIPSMTSMTPSLVLILARWILYGFFV
jgi:hypothetical protein